MEDLDNGSDSYSGILCRFLLEPIQQAGRRYVFLPPLFSFSTYKDSRWRDKEERERRLTLDYAPRNWRYRWILLDGSLALIYLMVFMAVAWLWRPVSLPPLLHPHSTYHQTTIPSQTSTSYRYRFNLRHPLQRLFSEFSTHPTLTPGDEGIANGRPETTSDSQCRRN
jgi:hypothetical protein